MHSAESSSAAHFEVETFGDGMVFRLCRPHKLNAMTQEMKHGLGRCLDEAEHARLRWLVVIGEGERAFCAGTDLTESAGMPVEARAASADMARSLLHRLSRSHLLSVAALNGLAFGGGLELAMACTFRIAARHVQLSLPEIKLGLIPSYGGTQFLPAIVGEARALDLMLTGRALGAEEALAMGLVSRIAEPDTPLLEQARALAAKVGVFGPIAIEAIRRSVEAARGGVTPAGLALEGEEVRRVARSEDAAEGVRAFLEKRAPSFKGR